MRLDSSGSLFLTLVASSNALSPSFRARRASSISDTNLLPSEAYIQVETDPHGIQWPWRVFKSDPNTPPNITITRSGAPLADGLIFMTPWPESNETHQSGGFIMTQDNEMVYCIPKPGSHNFRVQQYNGKPHLTIWNGYNAAFPQVGHGYGQVTFTDATYSNFSVKPSLRLNTLTTDPRAVGQFDIHEAQMTSRNTLLATGYNNTQADLRSLNDTEFWADAWITDGSFYEVDPETQEVLFEWHAIDHIDQMPFSASRQPLVTVIGNGTKETPWDWIHLNSVELVGDDYLVSARHTFSVFMVSGKNGSILWTLDGEKGGDFGAPPQEGTFRWQHDARVFNVTDTELELRLFDNHNAELFNGTEPSKAVVLQLQLPPNKDVSPAVVKRHIHGTAPLYADSMGSYNLLSNGNEIVGWGQVAIYDEYGPEGDLRWEGQFGTPGKVFSYHFYKAPWHATPAAWDPSLVIENGKAYVSWNGATEVEQWNVYAGNTEQNLALCGTADKKGFETVFEVPAGAKYVQVAAVQECKEVRRSNVALA